MGEWEGEAQNWIRWARTPGFDAYWYFRDVVFDAIVPKARRRTLEIGCGEGRVSRDLSARGHSVVACDTSVTLVRAAAEADGAGCYGVADGAALPFADARFDTVVAYNSLQVVADLDATVAEASRVLRAGGVLCACVVHPVTDLGRFVAEGDRRRFVLRDGYFETREVEDTVERDGFTMTFRGWSYPLERYAVALEHAGLRLELLREPRPTGPSGPYDQWRGVPLFLAFRAVKD